MPTLDDFAALLGERFDLQVDDAASLPVELVEAQPLGGAAFGGRQAFSLLFNAPATPLLPQRIYRLAHARLPALDIFLVPVGADAAGGRYQAIFS
jgi:hypothetical protein